jgi:rhodanese-related sulfurtransferase
MTTLIYIFAGAMFLFVGLPMLRNASPSRKKQLREMAEGGAMLIDVRSETEHASGHIFGSFNIPLQTLASKIGTLPQDKTLPIIVYCASGMRSGSAATVLQASGYTNVTNGGGYTALAAILGD